MTHLLAVAVRTIFMVLLLGFAMLVLGGARWVYRRVVRRTNEYGPGEEFHRMSDDEMAQGLQRVIDDPATSPQTRAKAQSQLKRIRSRQT